MAFKFQPQWQGPLSGRSFEKQTEDAINALMSTTVANASDETPLPPSQAGDAGSSEEWSRSDHRHPAQANVEGNAQTASRLRIPAYITLAGDASGHALFDGSAPVTISVSIQTATQEANGFMSSVDKAKLDGIAAGATAVTVDPALSAVSANPVENRAVQAGLDGLLSSVAAAYLRTADSIQNSAIDALFA